MNNNQMFNKFKSKLTWEAVLKSIMTGLSIGSSICGIISLICWLAGYKDGTWVALGVGYGLGVIAVPILFFVCYRPSPIQTGRRVDSAGLQERAVTMLQYQNDASFMATIQRADAVTHIASASAKAVKMSFPLLNIISTVCSVAISVPLTVVCGLYTMGVIQSPLVPENPFEQFVEATYIAEEGGEIIGETDQLLSPGESATMVKASPLDGYMFIGWSYNNDDVISSEAERTDTNITENLVLYAMFEPIGDGDDVEEINGDVPGNQGDEATDQPGDDGGQADGGDGDGSGNEGDGEGSGSGDQNKGEGKGDGQGDGAGGKWSEGNKIINGEIFYRDYLKQYQAEAMQELTSLENLPPELRRFIEAYYESV